MASRDELGMDDDDLPVADEIVDELVEPIIVDLVDDGREWERKKGKNTALGADTIVFHFVRFVRRLTAELGRLTRENEGLRGEIKDLMETFAGLDPDAADKHAVVFNPLAQLAPMVMIARRASSDSAVRLHSTEVVLVHRRKAKTKAKLKWVYDSVDGHGSMANLIVLVVNGSVMHDRRLRPFTGPIAARPLAALGDEINDAMIARLASAMLDDYREVVKRLAQAGETSASQTLKYLPFIVEHQDYGAPLGRGSRPPMNSHFVPGTSQALLATLVSAGRPTALMANPRPGMAARNRSIGRLIYARSPGGSARHWMDEREVLRRLHELAATGDLDNKASERLLKSINGVLVNPERGAGEWALIQLLGTMFVSGSSGVAGEAIQVVPIARISPTGEVQLFVMRAGDRGGYRTLVAALEQRYRPEIRIAHESCLGRWRERAAALFVLNGGASATLRAGIEAAAEVANWTYIFAVLSRRR